jgi:uncharacterized protein CbrC (UPF0167 family)
MATKKIYDCGCTSRPQEQSCKTYGTRWRVLVALDFDGNATKLLLRCRDCGNTRHFNLLGRNNPVLIQYGNKEDEE